MYINASVVPCLPRGDGNSPKYLDIFRDKYGDCHGYTDTGEEIVSSFWDWCCMKILIANEMEHGMSKDDAYEQFWNDVCNFDEHEFNLVMQDYDSIQDAEADGVFDDLRYDYLCSLGFTECRMPGLSEEDFENNNYASYNGGE